MNAMVGVQNIMQAVNWSKYSLEEWLYQFGAWMNSVSGTCGKSINPIAVAMDEAVVKQRKFKLGVRKTRQIIADSMLSEEKPKLSRVGVVCEIDDNEARAVQRLILDMQGQSEIMDEWMDAIICRYFYGNSWSQMVKWEMNPVGDMVKMYSENDARADVKCGLAALHCRYKFIEYK
ncbi:hypothetical protein QUG64_06405 [Acinetobacter lwoffii]|uniref:Phage antitermination protein Q n=1 Tax=Acinetobacter lwoffii NCTC 5866 = CIP 64.10 = NIPH 512 TaxID=981327 RepID=A0ABP2ZDM9_ACILW|nr:MULTISPECIES: hypothetical protein [Acinetobacter]ENU16260.1 hypothetical protein F995_01736 [Acinetobacter sp. CIP A162]ESJ95618.1 hypothetical protein P800_00432 [Acinetobacter lwoffii NCTC 5866 = CIP 64.10 = NIPH 512]QXB40833.1 hypothetical protein I6L23_01960 [Acinetobacter lwoffii]QZM13407.1 hypothetical protein ABVS_2780 [Acinetobacter lwoffii]SUU31594.1 Phage antitermination protein Q [Acinetobacter lwoffii]